MRSPSPRARRRRPRNHPDLATYLVVGAVLGFVAGTALAIFGQAAPMSSVAQQVVLLGTPGAAVGVLLASIAYLVADWFHDHPRLR